MILLGPYATKSLGPITFQKGEHLHYDGDRVSFEPLTALAIDFGNDLKEGNAIGILSLVGWVKSVCARRGKGHLHYSIDIYNKSKLTKDYYFN